MKMPAVLAYGITLGMLSASSHAHAQYIQKLAFTFTGDSYAERFGVSVANAGDVNNDGYDDVIIGAHQDMEIGLFAVGSVSVISGFDGSVLHKRIGDAANDRLGTSVAGAGDINNDGYDDFLAGAPNANSSRGYTRVFSGIDGSTLYTIPGTNIGDKSGFSIDGIGDINNDNYDDYIIGDPSFGGIGYSSKGRVRVFSGRTGEELYTFIGNEYDLLGVSVSGFGDMNNDGVPDFAAGAPGGTGVSPGDGVVILWSGIDGSVIRYQIGDSAYAGFGNQIQNAGDVDSDGFPDYVISSPRRLKQGDGIHQGTVQLFSGKDGTLMWQWWDPDEWSNFGTTLSGGTDVNGDGHLDIGVGAPFHDENNSHDGSVAICSTAGEPSHNAPVAYSWHDNYADERLGHGLSTGGDLNGDGIGDVVIGVPRGIVNGVSTGLVKIYVSTPGYCDGDVNADGIVNVNDLSYVIFRLGNAGAPGIRGDANVSGTVDVNDISHVLFYVGATCP
jgi:hypothetical protein